MDLGNNKILWRQLKAPVEFNFFYASTSPPSFPYWTSMHWWQHLLAIIAVSFIGVSKAGFGGGLGILTTPLCVLAFGPKNAIGLVLPLLSAGDIFSLIHYRGCWDRKNLWYLLPGIVVGVLVGVKLIGRFSARELNVAIGIIAVLFVVFQLFRERIIRSEKEFAPNHLSGFAVGVGAGITSSFAHGAGPIVTMFLIPQRMPKQMFVATSVLIFTWINWIKLPFFFGAGLINGETLKLGALYFPLVPLGVWLGIWTNRRIPEGRFFPIIYGITLLAGLELIFDPIRWFH